MKRLYCYIIISVAIFQALFAAPAKKAKKADAATIFQNAQEAFFNYEFDEAADLLEEYEAMQSKAKKPLDESFERWLTRVNNATNAFDRVQKIVVIDSINMPRASFFNAFRLSESSGKVNRAKDFNLPVETDNEEVSFLSENKDYLVTAVTDQDGEMRLKEYRKLLDGTWYENMTLKGDFELSGDYAFPFLNGDGLTIYFGNNGEESIGGYDLFVAQKEPITGESLQPLNLGMPFNSPYDDLMIVIDEEKGLGWWATDRNSPGEDITIYVYILDEVRKNYPSDTENLIEKAKISNYKDTWEEGKETEYKKILNSLKQ